MNSYFVNIKNKKKIFLNNAKLELFPKPNHENFFSKIWEEDGKLKKNYDELSILYFKTLTKVAFELNKYHNKNYSIKFWEILIGYWLHHFLSKYYEKLNSLKVFFETYDKNELNFFVKKYNNIKFIPLEYEDFNYYQYDHDFNSNCQKEVLDFLNFKNFSFLKKEDDCLGIDYIKKN